MGQGLQGSISLVLSRARSPSHPLSLFTRFDLHRAFPACIPPSGTGGCGAPVSGSACQGAGCRVQGAGFRVQGVGFRVQGGTSFNDSSNERQEEEDRGARVAP